MAKAMQNVDDEDEEMEQTIKNTLINKFSGKLN
jgi:hypothetical protein